MWPIIHLRIMQLPVPWCISSTYPRLSAIDAPCRMNNSRVLQGQATSVPTMATCSIPPVISLLVSTYAFQTHSQVSSGFIHDNDDGKSHVPENIKQLRKRQRNYMVGGLLMLLSICKSWVRQMSNLMVNPNFPINCCYNW